MTGKRKSVVITTITNWDEIPRLRHEVARQLSRFYDVYYYQLYCQRGLVRRERVTPEGVTVKKVGWCFYGLFRVFFVFQWFMRMYNGYVARKIKGDVKKNTDLDVYLVNFQYNFPQIYDKNIFERQVYICNEDFVNQNLCAGSKERSVKERAQREVIANSDSVVVVSDPLKKVVMNYGASKVDVIYSGHNFDLALSKSAPFERDRKVIRVCYMGYLTQYICVDWMAKLLDQDNIFVTIIGPVSNMELLQGLSGKINFEHVEFLLGRDLQERMLQQDVLLMPYSSSVDNEVTTVPAKLFQYLAVGKPIVSSEMQNLIPLPEKFVYKSKDYRGFLRSIEQAYQEDSREKMMERIDYSSNHTWDRCGEKLRDILEYRMS